MARRLQWYLDPLSSHQHKKGKNIVKILHPPPPPLWQNFLDPRMTLLHVKKGADQHAYPRRLVSGFDLALYRV